MLREQIKAHNILNGFLFSTIEFSLVILLLLPIAGYYIIHETYFFAFMVIGIILNCCPIPFFGIQSLLRHETSIGIKKLYEPLMREKMKKKYPHMLLDTMTIVITTLIPYVGIAIVLFELFKGKSARS